MRPGIILARLKLRPSKEENLGLSLGIGQKQLCGLPYILIIELHLAVSFNSMNQAVLGVIESSYSGTLFSQYQYLISYAGVMETARFCHIMLHSTCLYIISELKH